MNDYDVGKIFQEIELQLIKSMKRNLRGHELDELVEGFKWEQWQAKKIRELRKYRKQNEVIMQSYKSILDKATRADLIKQFLEGGRKVDSEIKHAIKGGYLTKRTPSDDFFQGNNKKLDALIKSVNDDMTNAQTAALRKMDDVYRQTIFKAEAFTATGASTVKQAVDMATKDFLAKGINCITYKNGRNVNIASYARMAVRTANKRVHLMGEGERRKEWGESLVLVSQYLQCSPLCIDWQGRVYIDDVYSGGKAGDGPYPLLSTAISGDLFHPNCRHTMSTYFEGISDEPELMNDSEIGENYEQTQQEAYINRNIQKYTRLKTGSVDEGNRKVYADKLKQWEERSDSSTKVVRVIRSIKQAKINTITDRREQAKKILDTLGVETKIGIRDIKDHGYCSLSNSDGIMNIGEYVLNKGDQRGYAYKTKTAFHEAFHALANGKKTDFFKDMSKWTQIEETLTESAAHYMTKISGIANEISPSYAEKLVEMLPRLKQIDRFKNCTTIADFGKIALKDRINGNTGELLDLYNQSMGKKHEWKEYSKQYFGYIIDNKEDLVDKVLENMPQYKDYRSNFLEDCDTAIEAINKGEELNSKENTVFNNILAVAMNRKGVK